MYGLEIKDMNSFGTIIRFSCPFNFKNWKEIETWEGDKKGKEEEIKFPNFRKLSKDMGKPLKSKCLTRAHLKKKSCYMNCNLII